METASANWREQVKASIDSGAKGPKREIGFNSKRWTIAPSDCPPF